MSSINKGPLSVVFCQCSEQRTTDSGRRILLSFQSYVSSQPGPKRAFNEDSYLVGTELGIPKDLLMRCGVLYAVADGMSGHAAGQVASKLAVTTLKEYYTQPNFNLSPLNRLEALFQNAHERILATAQRNAAYKGMGTTLTAVILKEGWLYYGHVGDSRLYLITGATGRLEQITSDHTLVARYLREGKLSAQEAEEEDSSILEQALGFTRNVKIDLGQLAIKSGDYIILTTDGLTKSVSVSKMKSIVLNSRDAEEVCKKLVRKAIENGIMDDITVIVIEVMGD